MDCSVLKAFKGYLYAGVWNHKNGCQIWRTDNISHWGYVVANGFGNKNNTAVWVAEIFNDYLYVGTMNFKNGCEVYRTYDGIVWEKVVGKNVFKYTRPVTLKSGRLVVNVSDSSRLYELTLKRRELIKDINKHLKKKKIKEIRFKIGEI